MSDALKVYASTGERMVFQVQSRTDPKTRYRVELIAEGGATRCACRDWATRRWPNIKAGMPHGTRSTLCIHGIAARREFLNDLLHRIASDERE